MLLRIWLTLTAALLTGLALWAFAPVLVFLLLLTGALGIVSAAMIALARLLRARRDGRRGGASRGVKPSGSASRRRPGRHRRGPPWREDVHRGGAQRKQHRQPGAVEGKGLACAEDDIAVIVLLRKPERTLAAEDGQPGAVADAMQGAPVQGDWCVAWC